MSAQKCDYASSQEVRWCPGCGDYAILANLQKALANMGVPREHLVFISGIGCAGRLPYYMAAHGFHTIHGRAPTIATGLKLARPESSVWVITGDGDGFSIGTNHLLHLARRNVDLNVLIFNNQIYGLTKGQYSPTSKMGLVTKTSPKGSLERPFEPLQLLRAAGASFLARAIDNDAKHLQEIVAAAEEHRGTSFIEIYQNCPIFNDGVYGDLRDKTQRDQKMNYIEGVFSGDEAAFTRLVLSRKPVNVGIFHKEERARLDEAMSLNAKSFDLAMKLKGKDSWKSG